MPITLYGGTGNYASALFVAAKRSKVLDQVESEILDLIEASKKSPKFSLFLKDLSVRADTRVKAINEICATAKFSEITKNFLGKISFSCNWYLKPENRIFLTIVNFKFLW